MDLATKENDAQGLGRHEDQCQRHHYPGSQPMPPSSSNISKSRQDIVEMLRVLHRPDDNMESSTQDWWREHCSVMGV